MPYFYTIRFLLLLVSPLFFIEQKLVGREDLLFSSLSAGMMTTQPKVETKK